MTAVRAYSAAELALSREVNGNALDYVGFALCKAARGGNAVDGLALFAAQRPGSRNIEVLRKAAMAPGMSGDPVWAGPLAQMDVLVTAFGQLLRPAEVLGRLWPQVRQVPFNVKIPRQTAGSSAGWTGEGAPASASALAFDSTDFQHYKLMCLVAITAELARLGRPDAVKLVASDLVKASAQASDEAFLDPNSAGVAGVKPPAVTHNAPSITASGTDTAAFRLDAAALIAAMSSAGTGFGSPSWVTSPQQAAALRLLDASLVRDGGLAGWPILETTSPAVAGRIVLIVADELDVGDGGAEVDASQEALLEMAAPATDPPTSGTVLMSLWQLNLTALRVVRYLNWLRTRPGSVGVIEGANYGFA
jgi:hypothetical protein